MNSTGKTRKCTRIATLIKRSVARVGPSLRLPLWRVTAKYGREYFKPSRNRSLLIAKRNAMAAVEECTTSYFKATGASPSCMAMALGLTLADRVDLAPIQATDKPNTIL